MTNAHPAVHSSNHQLAKMAANNSATVATASRSASRASLFTLGGPPSIRCVGRYGLSLLRPASGLRRARSSPGASLPLPDTTNPSLLGNGKALAGLAFSDRLPLAPAAVLVVLKPVATAACLHAGAIGGLLTPSLATGAVLGVLAVLGWAQLWPVPRRPPVPWRARPHCWP